MKKQAKPPSIRGVVLCLLALLNAVILEAGYTGNGQWYWGLLLSAPLLLAVLFKRPARPDMSSHAKKQVQHRSKHSSAHPEENSLDRR